MEGSRLDQRTTRLVTVVWLAPYLIEGTFLVMMCRAAEEKIATASIGPGRTQCAIDTAHSWAS